MLGKLIEATIELCQMQGATSLDQQSFFKFSFKFQFSFTFTFKVTVRFKYKLKVKFTFMTKLYIQNLLIKNLFKTC